MVILQSLYFLFPPPCDVTLLTLPISEAPGESAWPRLCAFKPKFAHTLCATFSHHKACSTNHHLYLQHHSHPHQLIRLSRPVSSSCDERLWVSASSVVGAFKCVFHHCNDLIIISSIIITHKIKTLSRSHINDIWNTSWWCKPMLRVVIIQSASQELSHLNICHSRCCGGSGVRVGGSGRCATFEGVLDGRWGLVETWDNRFVGY